MIKLKFIKKITHLIVICILSIFNQAQAKEKIDYSKYFSDPNEILFIKAVMKGDYTLVQKFYDNGFNINFVGKNELTPLRVSIKYKQKKILHLLLKLGIDPNFETTNKAIPAFAATETDDSSYLKILLDYGLNPNIKQDGQPLIFAAIRRSCRISCNRSKQFDNYHLLINRSADIHSKTSNNTTLVLELVGLSEYDLATDLILKGVDFSIPNNTGLTVKEILINDQERLSGNKNDINFKKRQDMINLISSIESKK